MKKIDHLAQVPAFMKAFKDKLDTVIDAVNELGKFDGDSRTISFEDGIVRLIGNPFGGGVSAPADDEYNGYFKVISSGSGKVKVVDGANPADAVAGYVKLGNARLPVAVAEFTVNSAGYIWIYTKNTSGTITAELKNGASIPAEVRGEDIREIGSYAADASCVQIWLNGEYVITGKAG